MKNRIISILIFNLIITFIFCDDEPQNKSIIGIWEKSKESYTTSNCKVNNIHRRIFKENNVYEENGSVDLLDCTCKDISASKDKEFNENSKVAYIVISTGTYSISDNKINIKYNSIKSETCDIIKEYTQDEISEMNNQNIEFKIKKATDNILIIENNSGTETEYKKILNQI